MRTTIFNLNTMISKLSSGIAVIVVIIIVICDMGKVM